VTEVRPPARGNDLSSLVSDAQRGDEDAFRALYRAVQPGLLRYLRGMIGDDAEDVASETWLQIARDLHSFRGTEGFRAWAARVARNRALDHLRHTRRRPAVPTPIEHLTELAANDDTGARAVELMSTDSAIALIATLPQDQAEAVLLRVVVGLDAETAAKVLGKRAGAVRTACYRGLRRLAERLNALAEADAGPPDQARGTRGIQGWPSPGRTPGVTHPRSAAPRGTR